jgi:IS30 family transposase
MDTVYGKGKACLLVLTERASRLEEIIKLQIAHKNRLRVHYKLEKRMGATAFRIKYKTITMANGGEFLNQALLEKSCLKESKNRTKAFYCHPISSWERGSYENQNAIIRRFIPKGSDISNTICLLNLGFPLSNRVG